MQHILGVQVLHAARDLCCDEQDSVEVRHAVIDRFRHSEGAFVDCGLHESFTHYLGPYACTKVIGEPIKPLAKLTG